jgi:cell division protein FtsB
METDPVKKAGLRKECESLENHEIALVREMRELKEERQRLARSS